MSDESKLLQLHIEEDRNSHRMLAERLMLIDAKLDHAVIDLATLRTEFRISARIAMAVVGFSSGIAGAVIIAVLI